MNKEIEMLNKKIEAQDKIINTQALEIARLKEEIGKSIEKLKEIKTDLDFEPWSIYQVEGGILFDLLELLGDKENE